MARYAITGATGFVGGALARRLIGAGHEVRALVRKPDAATSLQALSVRLVPGNVDCWTHVDDVAEGHVLAMERGQDRREYMLSGPVATLRSEA